MNREYAIHQMNYNHSRILQLHQKFLVGDATAEEREELTLLTDLNEKLIEVLWEGME